MRDKKELINLNVKNLSTEENDSLSDYELNCCDKCGIIDSTYDLVWITSDDFTPKEGEIIPEDLHKRFDALCVKCYLEEIIVLPEK